MPRCCRSLCVSTSMLMGTSWRFSSRLRAVITTSCSPPPAAPAVPASAGVRGAATLASAAATARPIREPGGSVREVLHKRSAARSLVLLPMRCSPSVTGMARLCAGASLRSSFVRTLLVNDRSTRAIRCFGRGFAASAREALETVPEGATQRLELAGEMPPVAHRRGVQRLTHLFGAGGAYRTPRLVKGNAGGFEGQPAMLEQAADASLRIAHQLLVLQVQHLAGEHRVPVIHERQIAAVVATEILEVGAEGLSHGEVLLEGAEARIHGMTAGVDNGRVRQDRVDQADVTEVIGQFVGEALTPVAQRCRLRDVTGAECREVRGGNFAHGRRGTVPAASHSVELARDDEDVRQLHGAFHARVAGKDLLHQRGARARQADDEDRRAAWVATAGTPGEERLIEERANTLAAAFESFDIEWRIEAPQRVALRVMREGVGVLPALLASLPQRKMQLRL